MATTEESGAFIQMLAGAGEAFRFCPSCSSPRILSRGRGRSWICPDCGFEYFHNVAAAAGIVLEREDRILLLVRAKEPARGRLALPGGFVDPGERGEDAVIRECGEEIGWAPGPGELRFLTTYPNLYRYRDIPYATCDLFFNAEAPSLDPGFFHCDESESSAIIFVSRDEIPWHDIAFESTRDALRFWMEEKNGHRYPRRQSS